MLCEECHELEAEVLVTEVDASGNLKEKHLCKICAAKKGYIVQKQKPLTEMFADFLKERGEKEEEELTCSVCGMSWAEFRRQGRFGCAHCYREFGERIERLISRIQGTTRHTGREASADSQNPSAHKDMEVKRLRKELAKAIQEEEYEKAARLRDDLRKFEERSG
ncbi:UvrB/UvrC motif-containing protein [candidate division WOR-3 bacterium]|nr:UvrB/UvrC motif-containing protein [candidate division WOR-3 bacterium]